MDTIISGIFPDIAEADHAIDGIVRLGFHGDELAHFYLSPRGQHSNWPDEDVPVEPEARSAGRAAGAGAGIGAGLGAVGGALIAPAAGVIAPLVGAALGAYAGSLGGAMRGLSEDAASPANAADSNRHAGIVVATRLKDPALEPALISVLKDAGAIQIEKTQGIITGGRWRDFDPALQPVLLWDRQSSAHP